MENERGQNVKVIVYHPKDSANISILQKRVAGVHADAVLRYLDKSPCPKEQKLDLLNAIIEKAQESS